MKVLIQRVSQSSVEVGGECVGQIGKGILLLLGVEAEDSYEHVEKALKKVLAYRIFSDEQGKMNLNIQDAGGQLLIVSQFTLVAQTNKGNRPGFSKGATPSHGEDIYNQFVKRAKETLPGTACGQFGADMQVSLINDGPVTFMFEF